LFNLMQFLSGSAPTGDVVLDATIGFPATFFGSAEPRVHTELPKVSSLAVDTTRAAICRRWPAQARKQGMQPSMGHRRWLGLFILGEPAAGFTSSAQP